MIFIIMLYPKIELQSFSRSAEPVLLFYYFYQSTTAVANTYVLACLPACMLVCLLALASPGVAEQRGVSLYHAPQSKPQDHTGSALRENDCNSILGYNMIIKIIIFQFLTLLNRFHYAHRVGHVFFTRFPPLDAQNEPVGTRL